MKTKANRNAKSVHWFFKHKCISYEWGTYPKETKHWKKWVKYRGHIAISRLWYSFGSADWNSYPVMHNCKCYSLVIFNEDKKICYNASFGSRQTKAQLKKRIDGYINYKPRLKEIREESKRAMSQKFSKVYADEK